MKLTDYEERLLSGWEDVFKKGQLSLWILLALKDGSKHMAIIKDRIDDLTNHTIVADDKSMYRALRRYKHAQMIEYTTIPSNNGPDLKEYSLTDTGRHLLNAFVARNIKAVYYKPEFKALIEKG